MVDSRQYYAYWWSYRKVVMKLMYLTPEKMKVYKNRETGKWVSYCPTHYRAQSRPTQLSALDTALTHIKWFHKSDPPVGVVKG